MSPALTPEHLAEIRARQNHGGVWSTREAQMKSDIAALLAEVERLSTPKSSGRVLAATNAGCRKCGTPTFGPLCAKCKGERP